MQSTRASLKRQGRVHENVQVSQSNTSHIDSSPAYPHILKMLASSAKYPKRPLVHPGTRWLCFLLLTPIVLADLQTLFLAETIVIGKRGRVLDGLYSIILEDSDLPGGLYGWMFYAVHTS